METSKFYLAFKGVDAKYRSAFIRNSLAIQYRIGEEVKRSANAPMWLVPFYCDWSKSNFQTGCDSSLRHLLLVRVPVKHVVHRARFVCDIQDSRLSKKSLLEKIRMGELRGITGATRLKVLEEVPSDYNFKLEVRFKSINDAMNFYENKYQLARIPAPVSIEID